MASNSLEQNQHNHTLCSKRREIESELALSVWEFLLDVAVSFVCLTRLRVPYPEVLVINKTNYLGSILVPLKPKP